MLLALQYRTRRVIGTVDLRVAVQTRPIEGKYGLLRQGTRLVATLHVALLAEARHLGDQHLVIGGPVSIVADHAVFFDRRMLPKDWGFLFAVALVAFIVDRFGINQSF